MLSINFERIFIFLAKLLLCIKLKKDVVVLADAIFDPKMELVDNFPLFEYLLNKTSYKPFYILHEKHYRYEEVCKKYPGRIIPFNGSYKRLMVQLLPLFPHLRFWLDGYFLLIGPLKLLVKVFKTSGDVISVNTQHGVTHFKIGIWEKGKKTLGPDVYNAVVVSTKEEYNFFVDLGFDKASILPVGLTRWSEKWPKPIKKILFFFTWRESFRGKTPEEIRRTDYYKSILNLMQSSELQKLLKKYDYQAVLALHHVLYELKLDKPFNQVGHIKLINFSELSTIKQKCELLITDYSSMCFDFAFQGRDVLFLQLDSIYQGRDGEAYRNVQRDLQGKNYFCQNNQCLIQSLENYFQNKVENNVFKVDFLAESPQSILPTFVKILDQLCCNRKQTNL